MNASSAALVLVAFLALGVAAQARDADLGPSPGARASREQVQDAEPQANKKDKRGLLGPVFGYDGYAQPAAAPYAVPVAYADAYAAAPYAQAYSPFAYAAYKTPAVAAPYALTNGYATSYANGYAGPVAKVAYSPAFAAPAAAAYAAYADGVYSKVGAYAFPAPYGYVQEGYVAPAVHSAYAY